MFHLKYFNRNVLIYIELHVPYIVYIYMYEHCLPNDVKNNH